MLQIIWLKNVKMRAIFLKRSESFFTKQKSAKRTLSNYKQIFKMFCIYMLKSKKHAALMKSKLLKVIVCVKRHGIPSVLLSVW